MTQLTDDCFAFGGALLPADTALARMTEKLRVVVDSEEVALDDALGRALAVDLVSGIDVPPHANAAVDGYALRFADLAADGDSRLRVAGRAAAGQPFDGACGPGEAIRIFTGAWLPAGSDSVVMQEDVRRDGDVVIVPPGLREGSNRRRAGEDIQRDAVILARGQILRPQDLGLAASIGQARLTVYRALRVALFSTGDELREPGAALAPGAIYDSNRHILKGLLARAGAAVTDLGILADRADAVRAALAAAAESHDLLITSGGVSTGETDHVRAAVEALGRIDSWRVAIKPGRPIALGHVAGTAFVGLPGNPVAAMICFMRFARPIIAGLGGATLPPPLLLPVAAGFAMQKKAGRREWIRARIERDGAGRAVARSFPRQGSGILTSMVASDGLVELLEETTDIHEGDTVPFLPFSEVLR
ncbi:molybdopterin molybdotransferase MoeA [Oceanibacterium hippocampi]|uniref:Molybdopterin molybdenumtransferase n=1 Tax=Oceanibacterium hippocampi TaxID=745714 RepID=A0A1Y5TZI2_9PROT|nr:gephyrin-like molybdotransferase Glp [Oceanibacterium hippocampi]SLN74462.1 Molybdopterin molybdenumtransferase [Oceanibacterium hippocampi]